MTLVKEIRHINIDYSSRLNNNCPIMMLDGVLHTISRQIPTLDETGLKVRLVIALLKRQMAPFKKTKPAD